MLIYYKHFLSVLRKSKTLVFFLRTSGEYSKKCRFWKLILKTDPYPYPVNYSLDVIKNEPKVLDVLITDKNVLKNKMESSPQ